MNPGEVDFGTVDTSLDIFPTKLVTIESTGTQDLVVDGISLAGPDAEVFDLDGQTPCETTLEPGETCRFAVTLDHGTPGDYEAEIAIDSNTDPDSYRVPVRALVQRTTFNVAPGGQDFGSAEIGAAGPRPERTFTITSSGSVPVAPDPTLTGADAGSFRFAANGCAGKVAPGASCQVTVAFDPREGSAGSRSAKLRVHSPGLLVNETGLTGNATPAVGPPAITLKLASPGKVKRGKTVKVKATVRNTGGTAGAVSLKVKVPGKLASAPKQVKAGSVAPGSAVTKTIKIKVKKKAKKGKKLVVTVTPSLDGKQQKAAKRTLRIR